MWLNEAGSGFTYVIVTHHCRQTETTRTLHTLGDGGHFTDKKISMRNRNSPLRICIPTISFTLHVSTTIPWTRQVFVLILHHFIPPISKYYRLFLIGTGHKKQTTSFSPVICSAPSREQESFIKRKTKAFNTVFCRTRYSCGCSWRYERSGPFSADLKRQGGPTERGIAYRYRPVSAAPGVQLRPTRLNLLAQPIRLSTVEVDRLTARAKRWVKILASFRY